MKTASPEFATAIRQKYRKTGARVQLDILTQNIEVDSWGATAGAPYSNLDQLHDGILDCSRRIATCEPDRFKLDNKTALETTSQIGYVSDALSDADGVVDIELSVGTTEIIYDGKGFTLFFDRLDDEYPVDFDVAFFVEGFDSGTYEFRDNTESYITIEDNVVVFDSVDIRIYKWSKPFHRVKMSEFVFGLIQQWGTEAKTGLISLENTAEIDVTAQTQPYGDVQAVIDNRDLAFNVLNPQGLARWLREGMKMTTFHGVMVNGEQEFVKTGQYYFKEWQDAGNNSVQLTGVDTLGYFGLRPVRMQYEPSVATPQIALMNLKDDMEIELLDIDDVPNTGSYLVQPYEELGIDELRSAAEYLCKVLLIDENGLITFEDLPADPVSNIPRDLSKIDPKITQIEQIAGIDIFTYDFNIAADSELLFEQEVNQTGTVSYQYEIGYDYTNPQITVTGGGFMQLGVSYGVINFMVTGTGTITIKIEANRISYPKQRWRFANGSVTDPRAPYLEIDNKHIMTYAKAEEVASWVMSNFNKWYNYECQWIGDPRLEVGDMVSVGNRFDNDRPAIIQRRVLRFTGGLSSELELRGS